MFHTGGWFSYSAIAVVYHQENLAYFMTLNGPYPRPDSAMYPLSYLVSDVLLQEARWINTSVACSYPSPWKTRKIQDLVQNTKSQVDYKEISKDASRAYIGIYGHRLYGNVEVFYENNTLMVNMTHLLGASLMYDQDSDSFDLKPNGPIGRLYASRKSQMKFIDKREKLYYGVELLYPNWIERFQFHRDTDFFADISSHGFRFERDIRLIVLIITLSLFSDGR